MARQDITNGEQGLNVRNALNSMFTELYKALILNTTQTNDYTLALTDINTVVDMNKATAINLTVPPNSSVAFDIGSIIYTRRIGAGTLTVVAGGGVTITGSSGLLTDAGQNVMMTLRKTATDTWDLQNGISYGVWTSYTPTWGGMSADPTGVTARYMVIGKTCWVNIRATANGTSNANTMTVTLPFAAAGDRTQIAWIQTVDNGTVSTSAQLLITRVGSTTADAAFGGSITGFTTSGGKRIASGTIVYEMQ